MDRILEHWIKNSHDKLEVSSHTLLHDYGVVIQTKSDPYDYSDKYWEEYQKRRDSDIAEALNEYRHEFSGTGPKFDVGIGNGHFLETAPDGSLGYDINPHAVHWMEERNLYFDLTLDVIPPEIETVTFWDTIEHVHFPQEYFSKIQSHQTVCFSLPIFHNLRHIGISKHFKPDEHLYYFTRWGFIRWIETYGFQLTEFEMGESDLGRECIGSFKFKRIPLAL